MRTTCRVCEAACGLLAEVDGAGVVGLRPDPDHPISRGYACVKGTRYAERVQRAPDRVLRPRLRDGDGWREVGWDEASRFVGGRLRAILDAHGPEAVGLYTGNAVGHSLGAVLGATALQRAIGTTKHYSCLSLDNSEMFVVAEEVLGDPLATAVADYEGSDAIALFGTDPLSSQASQSQSQPRATDALRRQARAGRLVVVDPRRSVTAAAGHHLAIRPGADVFLLAWLLGAALHRRALGRMRPDPALVAATDPFDRDRVARVTGLAPAALDHLRDRLLGAERPLVWSGLGVLLGPQGTLGWWLTLCLQATLSGLGTPGGWRFHRGAADLGRWLRRLGVRGRDPSVRSVGGWPAILGTLPAATLADDVLRDAPDRLRALIVLGGDPAAALPDTTRAGRALASLDLLVSVDLFARGTAAGAHAVLPAATWLEREETGLHASNQRPVPHVRLDRAVVPPAGESREDWRVALDLCDAIGRPPLGSRPLGWLARRLGPTGVARAVLLATGVPWRAVASEAGWTGSAISPPLAPRLAVPEWCEALGALPDPEPGLRLVTSARPLPVMNHWLGPRDGAREARVHPDDAAPGPATLIGPGGELDVVFVADPVLARGTVVLPYGDRSCNPNVLVGTRDLEPFSGQPVSNGTRVAWRGRPRTADAALPAPASPGATDYGSVRTPRSR